MDKRKEGNIHFINVKCIEDFQIVHGTCVKNAFPMHRHEKYCIGAIEKGSAILSCQNKDMLLETGSIYMINPFEPHQIKPLGEEGFNHIVLSFGEQFLNRYFSDDIKQNYLLRFPVSVVYNTEIFNPLLDLCKMSCVKTPEDIECSLILLLSEFYNFNYFTDSQHLLEQQYSDIIQNSVKFIERNFAASLSLQELAKQAGLSKFHFLRQFKDKIGITPYDYQLQYKIKIAQRLLREGSSSVSTALELGFTDQSHFNKFFKRNVGVTPTQFIKMNIHI